ncbi:hypothetical protein QCA50_002259 [Cerrena zonata]|uniref:H/ACA ribonucleoprotein complex non-core subunit NAF1 n=1 Tax=Cerrena zonata TaxID=2478898 RepID=A0AAW0GT78_9APHY
MEGFKIPSDVPQDLQLIQDIIGDLPVSPVHKTPSPQPPPASHHEDIDSSDDDADSEKEVEADILSGIPEDEDENGSVPEQSESTNTDSDSSDSESESEANILSLSANVKSEMLDFDEDEDTGAAITSDNPLRTKNEVPEADIVIPEIDEVDADEVLEKVGEVMSIVGQVAIVMGLPSHIASRANERALDSDTLLVFDDRKVFGYVYETFGPTSQPMYQVKFNQKYPLDPDKVRVGRGVFHVPSRSRFIFVNQIKRFKGSDASNAYDEEPADDEVEFSDDEQEQAHKRALTQNRRAGGKSAASSRQATPTPAQMRDQDMAEDLYSANPYDQSYNDMDFGAGPSRPAPMPYDDPYSDSYGVPQEGSSVPRGQTSSAPDVQVGDNVRQLQRSRSQTMSTGPSRFNDRGRGRGRGGQRERGGRGRGRGRGRDTNSGGVQRHGSWSEDRGSEIPRPLSPASSAIARVTGQYGDGSMLAAPQQVMQTAQSGWDYNQYQQPNFNFNFGEYQQPYGVQPHINPRFASAFAYNFGMYPQQDQGMGGDAYGYGGYGQGSDYSAPNQSGTWPPQTDNSGHPQN